MRLMLHNVIELWYKRKKDEDLREQISNVFWISDIQHRRSDKIFLGGGRGGEGGRERRGYEKVED